MSANKIPQLSDSSKQALADILPELKALQESYESFLDTEKARLEKIRDNLKILSEIEFGDDLDVSDASKEILEAAYGADYLAALAEST